MGSEVLGLGFRVWGLEFGVWGRTRRGSVLGVRAWVESSRVQVSGFRVSGFGFEGQG